MNDSDFLRFEQLYQEATNAARPHHGPAFASEQAAAFRVLWPELVRLREQFAALRAAVPSAEVLRRGAIGRQACYVCPYEHYQECVGATEACRDAAALRQAAAALEKLEER